MQQRWVRTVVSLFLLVTGMATACTASKVPASASVTVSGSVVDASGAPVAGAKVVLFKEADFGEMLAGITTTLSTLGIACFFAQAPTFCSSGRKTTTDASGSFSYAMSGADTQGLVGDADTFDVTALLPAAAGGTSLSGTSASFTIQRTSLTVPALRPWGAMVDVTPGGAGGAAPVRISWPALPAADGRSPSYTVAFEDATGRNSAWSVAAAQSPASIDPRVLEDTSGSVEVDATTKMRSDGTTFTFTYRSATSPFSGPGAPPSRGAPCTVTAVAPAVGTPPPSGAGSVVPGPRSPCPVTNGDLLDPKEGLGTALVLDLGSVRPVSLVVIRGLRSSLSVEGSTDGQTWAVLGGADFAAQSTVHPPSGTRARYLRVRNQAGADLSGLQQISVW